MKERVTGSVASRPERKTPTESKHLLWNDRDENLVPSRPFLKDLGQNLVRREIRRGSETSLPADFAVILLMSACLTWEDSRRRNYPQRQKSETRRHFHYGCGRKPMIVVRLCLRSTCSL